MAIIIKQKQEKWIIEIREEEWEMQNQESMQEVLNSILAMKIKYGNIKKQNKYEN